MTKEALSPIRSNTSITPLNVREVPYIIEKQETTEPMKREEEKKETPDDTLNIAKKS